MNKIEEAYKESRDSNFNIDKWQVPSYHRVVDFTELGELKKTGLPAETLKEVGKELTQIPDSFNPHPSIRKIY